MVPGHPDPEAGRLLSGTGLKILLARPRNGYWFRVRSEHPSRRPFAPVLLAAALAVLPVRSGAEDIRFPADAGVVDVTRPPYSAKGDGRTDDTEAIQQALLDHPNANCIVYLPNGVYRVSAPLRWPGGTNEETRQRATILQGQSRTGAVIRLMDYSPGFGPGGRGRPILWMGEDPANRHRNAIRNLTVETGIGNPSASGVALMANQQGGLRDVTFAAGRPNEGIVGVDISHAETIGPCLLKGVRVQGFEFGIRAANSVNSCTMEDIELVGQGTVGIRNSGQTLNIRRLRSTNAVPAVMNHDPTGAVTLLDSVLHGLPARRAYPAILNRGFLYARGISTPGVTNAIESRIESAVNLPGPSVAEFLSHERMALFMAPPSSLGLPVEETPTVPWDPLDQWAGPLAHGGTPGTGADASAAIQRAIDSGATTVYLPNGVWRVDKTVEIRGPVRRIVGCEAHIVNGGLGSRPVFRVIDGDSSVVVVERLEVENGAAPLVENASKRTLVVSSCLNAGFVLAGAGPLFVEDVSSGMPTVVRGQKVWARQWDVGCAGNKVSNEGGSLWVFGLRTDKPGTVLSTTAAGRTELLGSLTVSNPTFKDGPMFVIRDASATFVGGEVAFQGNPYNVIVRETRGSITRVLERGAASDPGMALRSGGVGLALYAGYDGNGAVPPPKPRRKIDDKIPVKP